MTQDFDLSPELNGHGVPPPDFYASSLKGLTRRMDFPSGELVRLLTEDGLCTRRDLERCRPIVKRLSRDLPAFDSVWIDALVQRGVLTRYQSLLLESDDAVRLTAGPWVILDQMEPGRHCHTFRSRATTDRRESALKIFQRDDALPADFFSRFDFLASKLRQIPNPHYRGPLECLRLPDRFVLVSPFTSGRTLDELLVRRGRFAPRLVAEIGRQLIHGLAQLESRRIVHGDIHLRNVRINSAGRAVLVDAGIRPLIGDDYDLHTEIPLRRLEGLAPERIGTGQPADSRSDLYGLGCLLWQLLTSRPPFPTADPLARIAAHRTREVADVRDWSPDTPTWLAELIVRLTQRDPQQRPKSIRDVAERWGIPERAGKRRLAKFQSEFDGPQSTGRSSSGRILPVVATGLLIAAGFGLWQVQTQDGGRNPFLLQPNAAAAKTEQTTGQSGPANDGALTQAARADIQNLPQPDASGRILLSGSGSFRLQDISFAGTLHISGPADGPVHVIIPRGVTLSAAHIILKNLDLEGPRQRVSALMRCHCQTLTLDNCQATNPQQADTLFDWQPDDPHDRAGSRLALRNCRFMGNSAALTLREPPRVLQMDNVLKVGAGSLLRIQGSPIAGRDSHIQLRRVTLRNSGSLLRLARGNPPKDRHGVVQIRMTDCVFALRAATHAALLEILGDHIPASGQPLVHISTLAKSDASLIATGIAESVFLNTSAGRAGPVPDSAVRIEGLIASPLTFAGIQWLDPADSVLRAFEAPRMSEEMPGFHPHGLGSHD